MKANIPSSSKRIYQDNKNQFNGNISESFNLDLKTNEGKFGVNRCKSVGEFQSSLSPELTSSINIIGVGNLFPFFVGIETSISGVYVGTGATFLETSFTRDSSSVPYYEASSDMVVQNGFIYVSSSESVYYTDDLVDWTEIDSPALTGSTSHLMTTLGDNVYVSNANYKVAKIDSSNVLTLTGTGTIDLSIPGYTITALMSGLDRVWIGVSLTTQTSVGQTGICYVYEWDGESENTASQRYEIDAPGIICGVVKDGIPYILDSRGRLMVYVGSSFKEVARLPFKEGYQMDGFNSVNLEGRAIHPRSITVDQDEILINVSNLLSNSNTTTKYWGDFPSGVWAYSEQNGLYHKYSASYQSAEDTGNTNITDWGQIRVAQAGGIYVHDFASSSVLGDGGGRVIFSQRYFTDSPDGTSGNEIQVTYKTGLFANDTKNNTQKYGFFVVTELHTNDIEDAWQNIYAKYKRFLNETDKIVVKYRTDARDKITGDISWSDFDIITTTADLSEFEQGDEIQVIQGYGSGKSFAIESISENGGTYTIKIDDPVDTSCYGRSAVAQFSNFKKCGEITYENKMQKIKKFPILSDTNSPILQVKVCMQFTGNNELYGVQINSKNNINE